MSPPPEMPDSRRFSCGRCNRSFTRPENLSRHEITHQEVLPHVCTLCGKSFTRSDLCKKHEALHRRRDRVSRRAARLRTLDQAENEEHERLSQRRLSGTEIWQQGTAAETHSQPPPAWAEDTMHLGSTVPLHEAEINSFIDPPTFARGWSCSAPWPQQLWFSSDQHGTSFADDIYHQELLTQVPHTPQSGRLCPGDTDIYGEERQSGNSPTNELSDEDQGQSEFRARPIVIGSDDPLMRQHNTRFDISDSVWAEVNQFLKSPSSTKGGRDFFLPDLSTTNCFVGLFFQRFLHQMPVLHVPTTDSNTLPAYLLAVVIVIGASYSRLPHTRRFIVLMLDRTRRNLQSEIENDNGLVKDPLVIYTLLLICYTGLWCGDHRAYNFACIQRAAVVTYARQLPKPPTPSGTNSLRGEWHQWIMEESRTRLLWSVYLLDSQFPSLLYSLAMISSTEILSWECPCDERYWNAPTCRYWKVLLGPALRPPSPRFIFVISPFLYLPNMDPCPLTQEPIDITPWTALLVMTVIANQIFQYLQVQDTAIEVTAALNDIQTEGDLVWHATARTRQENDEVQRNRLLGFLKLWHKTYAERHDRSTLSVHTSAHFHGCGLALASLSRLILSVSVNDIQAAIAKGEADRPREALTRFRSWCTSLPDGTPSDFAITVLNESLQAISQVTACLASHTMNPVQAITLFLCHVAVWLVLSCAPDEVRSHVRLQLCNDASSVALPEKIAVALDSGPDDIRKGHAPRLVLQNGWETLLEHGNLGVAYSLARFLSWRSNLESTVQS